MVRSCEERRRITRARSKQPLVLAVALLTILLIASPLAKSSAGGAATAAPAGDPPSVSSPIVLTNTSSDNFFLSGRNTITGLYFYPFSSDGIYPLTSDDTAKASGVSVAWANSVSGQISFAKSNSTGALAPYNVTLPPGDELDNINPESSSVPAQQDNATILASVMDGLTQTTGYALYDTSTSTELDVPSLPYNPSGVYATGEPSSWGDNLVGIAYVTLAGTSPSGPQFPVILQYDVTPGSSAYQTWTQVSPSDWYPQTCPDNVPQVFRPTVPVQVLANGPGPQNFVWTRVDLGFVPCSNTEYDGTYQGVDVMYGGSPNSTSSPPILRFATNATSYQGMPCSPTWAANTCFEGLVGAWGNIVLYSVSTNQQGNDSLWLYDISNGNNILLQTGIKFQAAIDQEGPLVPGMWSDGKSFIMIGLNGQVVLYHGSKQLTTFPTDALLPGAYTGLVRVQGDWALWLDSSDNLNFYNMATGGSYKVPADTLNPNAVLDRPDFDFENGVATWLVSESAPSLQLVLFTFNATASSSNHLVLTRSVLSWARLQPDSLTFPQVALSSSGAWTFVDSETVNSTYYQVLAFPTPGPSCTYDAITSGDWNDPSIWMPTPVAPFPQTLPADCTANIPTGVTVTIPAGVTVASQGDIENHGMVSNLAGLNTNGTFNNFGSLNNFGGATLVISNGTLTDTGGVTNYAGGTFTVGAGATLTNSAGGDLDNDGMMSNSGTVANHGTLANFGGGTITNNATLVNYSGGALNNKGTFNNLGASTVNNDGTITNTGTIMNSGTLSNLNGHVANIGTMTVTGYGSLNNFATISNLAGATLAITGNGADLTNKVGGTVQNAGTLNIADGSTLLNFPTATVSNAGTLTNGGTVTNNGNLNNSAGATLTNAGTLANGGTVTNNGALTNNAGATLTNSAGSHLSNAGTLNNGGTVSNNGFMVNNPGATLTNTGNLNTTNFLFNERGATLTNTGMLTNGEGLYNQGTLNNAAGGTIANTFYMRNEVGGTLNNNVGATIEMKTGSTFSNAGTFNNLGTTTVDGSAVLDNSLSLDNSGTITIDSGDTLNNNGTITNSGTVTNDGTIDNTGTIENSGTISGPGTFTGSAIVEESSTNSPTSTSTQATTSTTQPSTSTSTAPPPSSSTQSSSTSSTSSSSAGSATSTSSSSYPGSFESLLVITIAVLLIGCLALRRRSRFHRSLRGRAVGTDLQASNSLRASSIRRLRDLLFAEAGPSTNSRLLILAARSGSNPVSFTAAITSLNQA